MSIQVEIFGTGKIPNEAIILLLEKHVDFRVAGSIKQFNLSLPCLTKGDFDQKLAA